jgi:hypothetical protein
MEDVRRTKNVYYIIIGIVGFVVSIASLSYAFFVAQVLNNESTSTIYGEAANLIIDFKEGTNQIYDTNIFPGWEATKNFSVINKSAVIGEYNLYIYDISNELMDGDISFEITSTNGGATIEKMNLPSSTTTLKNKISISGNTTQVYTVKVYYNNLSISQEYDKGKSFSFKIGIRDVLSEYTLTNMLTNGSFENGTTGWTVNTSTTKVETVGAGGKYDSKYVKITPESTWDFLKSSDITILANHKVYMSGYYRKIGGGSSTMSIYDLTNDKRLGSIGFTNDVSTWSRVSIYSTNSTSITKYNVLVYGASSTYTVGMYSEWDNIMLIDLTESFGSGNEPDKEWCDANLDWFEGTTKTYY